MEISVSVPIYSSYHKYEPTKVKTMKSKLLFLTFTILISNLVCAQNAPSIEIKGNNFYGIILEKNEENKYETLNYIDFTRDTLKIHNLKVEIKDLFEKIKKETDPSKDKAFRQQKLQKEKELVKTGIRKDSLWNEYVKEYVEYSPATLGFWKSRSQSLFDLIYHDDKEKKFDLLTNTGFNIGKNTGSIYSELVSGFMYVFRVSLGAMVASSSSTDSIQSKQEEAFQRLTTYGGNTVLTLEYPLLYAHTKNNQAIFLSRLIAKGTADFPEFGTNSDNDWAGSASFGIDLYGDIATSDNRIRFFSNLSWTKYNGSNKFKENLGLENSKFSFGQLKVGLTFSNVSLSFIVATFSSESTLKNRNVIAGGQILR